MDWASKLLAQAQPTARIDTRCLLPTGARIILDAMSSGVAPFHLLLDGEYEVHLADNVIQMRAGDFLMLPRGNQHEVRIYSADASPAEDVPPISIDLSKAAPCLTVAGKAPVVDLFCGHYSFEIGAGSLFLANIPDPLHVNLDEPFKHDVVHLTSLLRSVADSAELGASAMLDCLAEVLLVLALQASSTENAPSFLNVGDPAVRIAIEAVVADPGAKWTVEELAQVCHVSRATLVRRFRQRTGTTIADFVTWVRVMRAAELLRTSGRSVASVSHEVGYSSPSAFSRAFQAAVGTPPGRFAQNARD
jgi:AraC family transcriptional regulator, activator of mtrCDE